MCFSASASFITAGDHGDHRVVALDAGQGTTRSTTCRPRRCCSPSNRAIEGIVCGLACRRRRIVLLSAPLTDHLFVLLQKHSGRYNAPIAGVAD